ncbi:MAG: hypothetical protein JST59_01250 [Actinobacteria bacterium]|nr:hypothetical protein [Actinomycetota bacterium]
MKLKEREEMRTQYEGYRHQAEGLTRRLEEECRGYQNENSQLRRDIEHWKVAAEQSQKELEAMKGQLERMHKVRSEEESSLINGMRLQLKE